MDRNGWNLSCDGLSPRRRSMPSGIHSNPHHPVAHRNVSKLSTIDDNLLDLSTLSLDESPERNLRPQHVVTNVWSPKPKPVLNLGFSGSLPPNELNTSLTEKFHNKRRSLQPRRSASEANLAQNFGGGQPLFGIPSGNKVFQKGNHGNALFRPSLLAAQVAAIKKTDALGPAGLSDVSNIHSQIANPGAANCLRKRSRPDSGDSSESEVEESMEMDVAEVSASHKKECHVEDKSRYVPNKCKQGFCSRLLQWCHILVMCLVVLGGVLLAGNELRQQWCQRQRNINVTRLHVELGTRVYGQHIAVEVVSTVFAAFFDPATPEVGPISALKPLVLSFHGWTGVGKNYLSGIIASEVRAAGIHKVIVPLHFPHPEPADMIELQLEEWIATNLSQCAVNIFIFDEVDKGPDGFLDALGATLQFLHSLTLDNTKVIILLLSNSGAVHINKLVYQELLAGTSREQLSHDMFIKELMASPDPEDNWFQVFYSQNLISHLVPFLPLEKRHVQQCIISDLRAKSWDVTDNIIHQVAQELTYFPPSTPIFSKTGCRKVTSKVDLIVN